MTEAFLRHGMELALREADLAAEAGEVPTGCVILEAPDPEAPEGPATFARVLASAHNQTETLTDATAHAEMIAISQAAATTGDWRLTNAVLFVTKEPCPMCAGAIVLARIPTVVYGLPDPKRGGHTVFGILDHPGLIHRANVIPGVLEDICHERLSGFFRERRFRPDGFHGRLPQTQRPANAIMPDSSSPAPRRVRGLSLFSGGLDSLLAICVLREQGIEMTAITFDSPFFNIEPARKGAAMLGVPLKVVDYTDDIFELLDHNRYGFGSGMNPCIDCHARMIRRAAEIREAEGFDFISTGEVVGQRPMSQNRNSLNAVSKTSGAREFLLRPLSAQLLPPTPMEEDGRVDRSRLLALEGRSRKPQMELAAKYGITEYPSPAGGCRLTEPGFAKRLKEMKAHEGLERRALVDLLRVGRHFRLPGGSRAVVGRNRADNEVIRAFLGHGDTLLRSVDAPGPSVLLVGTPTDEDLRIAAGLCARYADGRRPDGVLIRFIRRNQPDIELRVPPIPQDEPQKWLI